MKKIIIAVISTIIFSINLFSQSNLDIVLTEIEKNNTNLLALRKIIDAEKIGNKTGQYLQNPEVGFNYLWGSDPVIGDRIDLSIIQTFDFPTVYRYKNQISDLKNEQTELEYQKQFISILYQSSLICIDLIYHNALKAKFERKISFAQKTVSSLKMKYELGEINLLDYNNAQLVLLNLTKELESLEIEKKTLLSDLAGYNGGKYIDFSDTIFHAPVILTDFEQWYSAAEQKNPTLIWLKQEIEISKKQDKLSRALSLPKLQAGYMSEQILNERLRGISVGLSIPLWENKNTVKYAKAETNAIESIISDEKLQFYNHLKTLHSKVGYLQYSVNDYSRNLDNLNNSVLLKKALDRGEISLLEYLSELSVYYESLQQLLDMNRELNKAIVELNQYL